MNGDGSQETRMAIVKIGTGADKMEAQAETLSVSCYPWGGEYRPETTAGIWLEDGVGFHVRMRCYETGMRAVNQQADDPVYEDSCMECFLLFYPEESPVYMNFEVNSNGIMLCQEGADRNERTCIRSKGWNQPETEVRKEADFWELRYVIPLSLIHQVYGRSDFSEGQKIKGNFYKCGDLTPAPHYGCWSPIRVPQPNYHRPEFFGELILRAMS